MLQLKFFELIFRVIPEIFILSYGIITISQEKRIQKKPYVILAIILSILVDLVRKLPISFGLHIVINIILTISVMSILGLPLIKNIYGTFFVYFIFSFSEFINMVILNALNISIYVNDINDIRKVLLGIPSLFIMIIFVFILKFILKKRRNMNVYH